MRKFTKTAATLALAGALAACSTPAPEVAQHDEPLVLTEVERLDAEADSLMDAIIDLEVQLEAKQGELRQARAEETLAGIRARQTGNRFGDE